MSNIDFNNPKEVQNELERLLNERFGQNIHILSHPIGDDKKNKAKPKPTDSDTPPKKELPTHENILQFNKTPKELKHRLDSYVIGQNEAKKTLAIAICNHYNQLKYFHSLDQEEKKDYEYSKQNLLLIGPTGVGKTYMVRQIAKMIDVPFVKADATKYSETGYMGGNVEDLVRDLVNQAGGDIQRAEHGIIYIDEADKLATSYSPTGNSKDISGRGVQLGLLKMLEETEIDLRSGHDPASQIQALMDIQSSGGKPKPKVVNTRHILFILSGAFSDLENIISKRLSAKAIGFMEHRRLQDSSQDSQQEPSSAHHFFTEVITKDLVEFGFEPEFIGRMPVRVACHPLSKDDLFHILKASHGSIIHQFQRSFAAYDIQLTFDDEALRTVASLALKENTGARSLVTILDRALKHFIFELPSSPIRSLQVTPELITSPQKHLKTLTATLYDNAPLKKAITPYIDNFYEKHHIRLTIEEDAYSYIRSLCNKDLSDVYDFLEKTLQPYEYALKIITQAEGLSTVTLHQDHLKNPGATFEQWIIQSFNKKTSQTSEVPDPDNKPANSKKSPKAAPQSPQKT
ncbi:MAG: AAA family ATPase [Proteobacteria bacterium]|nr:AAA family ATPase [Pseudomonadota bacterium]